MSLLCKDRVEERGQEIKRKDSGRLTLEKEHIKDLY